MKKPWVIGLLSIFPGIGLIALGQVMAGIGVMAGISVLVFLLLTTASADLSAWLFSIALILWMLQLGYAMLAARVARASKRSPEKIAQRRAKASQREAQASQRQAAAIQGEAREALAPLLLPGQHLQFALDGMGSADAHLLGGLLLALIHGLGGGAVTNTPDRPTTCLGITQDELVYATTRRLPRASDLRRVPLSAVSRVEFKEGRLGFDRLAFHSGKRRLVHLYTAKSLRPTVQELATTLAMRGAGAGTNGSSGRLQGTLAQHDPLHVRLYRLIEPVPRDIATTLRVNGAARASLRASRYSFILLGVFIVASIVLTLGLIALASIFPNGLVEPLRAILLFILILPVLLSTLLGAGTALVAAGLAIYSIFRKCEKPLTVVAALLGATALAFAYYILVVLLVTTDRV